VYEAASELGANTILNVEIHAVAIELHFGGIGRPPRSPVDAGLVARQ
jgi:hypothetical protein